MDSDSDNGTLCDKKNKKSKQGEAFDTESSFSNVFLAIWLRRPFRYHNEINRFILESGLCFLLYIGILFWIIFLFFWY